MKRLALIALAALTPAFTFWSSPYQRPFTQKPGAASAPTSAASTLSTASGRVMLVEFVSSRSDHAARLDHEIYRHPSVLSVLKNSYAVWALTVPSLDAGLTNERLLRDVNSYRPRAEHPVRGMMRIAVEDYPEVAERYRISGLPTFLVIDPSGRVLASQEGLMEPAEFAAFLAAAVPAPPAREELENDEVAPAAALLPVAPPAVEMAGPSWTTTVPSEPVVELARSTSPEPSATPTSERRADRTAPPEITTGRLTAGRKEMLFDRQFPARSLWTLDLNADPQDFDVDLEILDPSGNQVLLSEGNDARERLQLAVEAGGQFTVRVFAYREIEQEVEFTLKEKLEPLASDRVAPNVDRLVAASGEQATVRINRAGDYWVRYPVPAAGRYRVTHDVSQISGGQVEMTVVAPDGKVLGRATQDGVLIEREVAGAIFIRFSPASGTPRGTLSLTLARNTAFDVSEVRDSIRPGQRVSGRVGGTAGLDRVYRVQVPQDGRWQFNLKGAEENVDIDLEVLQPDGTLIERSEGPAGEEEVKVEINRTDERFVRVYVYRAAAPVQYTLELKPASADEPPPTGPETPGGDTIVPPSDAVSLGSNPVSGELTGRGANRWFVVTPSRTGLVAIYLDGGNSEQDIDLAAHRANGEKLGVSQSESCREALLLQAEAGVPVYVRVYCYGESEGGRFRVWHQMLQQ